MNKPVISICVMTFNQSRYIERCLESVLDESRNMEAEIYVGDDMSTDDTPEILTNLLSRYPGCFHYIRHAQRLGASQNTQSLLRKTRGNFIARVDGDDYWLPGKLNEQLNFMKKNSHCLAVYTNARTVDEQGNSIGLFNDVGDAVFDLSALIRRGNFLCNSSILLRRDGLEAYLDAKVSQIDYRVHLSLAQRGLVGHIGKPLTAYRVNARGSMVRTMNDSVRELYWEAIQSVPRDRISDEEYAQGLADFLRRVVFRAISTQRWRLLRDWAPRVFMASPYGCMRTSLLTLTAIIRILGKEFIGMFARDSEGKRARILYKR